MLLIVLIVLITIKISRCYCQSEKCQERIKKKKQTLFYQSLIRYTLVNCLKLNMMAILGLKTANASTTKDPSNMVVSSLILFVMALLLPLVFALVLYKRRDHLGEDQNKNSIGNLYSGRFLGRPEWN